MIFHKRFLFVVFLLKNYCDTKDESLMIKDQCKKRNCHVNNE